MRTPHEHQRTSVPHSPEASLRAPSEIEGLAAARERAFPRLYEDRIASRALGQEKLEMRRRDFLRTATLGAMATVGLGNTVATMAKADSINEGARAPERSQSLPLMFASDQAGKFLWEDILFQVGQWAFAHIAHEHKLPLGNASMASSGPRRVDIERAVALYEKNPSQTLELYSTVGVVGPIVEELMFRVFPSLMTQSPGMQWQVGIPFNLVYALMHSVVPESAVTKLSFPISSTQKISLDQLPLPQFVLGAFCWYCVRTYGSLAPILTHTFNNQIPAIVVAWGGKQTYEQFQNLLAEELASGKEL